MKSCQDLSLAGKGKGMSDTSTRSGMLWEVERILKELKETDSLPQVLLMENVPMVHSADNTPDFNKWQIELTKLGYKNYWEDLIATDYGIPQTRNRCFMVSILGDYNYTFPKPIKLEKKLKDMLEENVDEKYFLSDAMKKYIFSSNDKYKVNKNSMKIDREIACSKTTREGWTRADTSDYITENIKVAGYIPQWHQRGYVYDENNSMTTICATDYKTPKLVATIPIKNATKKVFLEATDGDGVDISSRMEHHRGTVQKGKSQTLTTQCDNGVVVMGNYTPSKHNASRIVDQNYSAPTVMENHGTITATQTSDLRIRKLTPRECFRLMNVKDEDFNKVKINQSDSSLYHLAGDSICSNVLMALFGEMFDIDWEKKVREMLEKLKNKKSIEK